MLILEQDISHSMLLNIGSFIVLAIILLSLSATPAISRLRHWWRWRRWNLHAHDLTGEPRCASCGHIVHPGSSGICCECGGNLNQAGIVHPISPRPFPPIASIAAIALLLLPLILHVAHPVATCSNYGWNASSWINDADPAHSYTAHIYGHGRPRTRFTHGEIEFHHLQQPILRKKGKYPREWIDLQNSPIDDQTILAALSRRTRDWQSPANLAMAARLSSELRQLQSSGLPSNRVWYGMVGTYALDRYSRGGPRFFFPWYTPYCLPLWLAITAASAWILLRRYHRRLAQFKHLQAALLLQLQNQPTLGSSPAPVAPQDDHSENLAAFAVALTALAVALIALRT